MILNPKRMYEQGIIFNIENIDTQLQQNGIDLRILKIYQLTSNGLIYKSKSVVSDRNYIEPVSLPEGLFWKLEPGYYGVTFYEGVKLPSHVSAEIKVRSSLLRSGAIVKSGFFDSGFETTNAGCFLLVLKEILIEEGARVAQIVFFHSDSAALYSGIWQRMV